MTTAELKRWSRRKLNRTRLAAGLPAKPDAVVLVRRLAPDDPRVIALKKAHGLLGGSAPQARAERR